MNIFEDGRTKPKTQFLDWNDYKNSECVKSGQKFDIIIGCELVYAVTECDNLINLIKEILAPGGMLVMIIPTVRTNREKFMQKMEELGKFDIHEEILSDDVYKMNPLMNMDEDGKCINQDVVDESGDIFYPLKSIEFRYLEIKFKN
jgi:2-polyprenyl-3-methyl-5-hydroxy-6-metoxy-1,4-benzoquinol methylase